MTTRSRSRATPAPPRALADASSPLPPLAPALRWRLLGPFRGGRVVAVAGDPAQRQTFYFGATGGGVWKTTTGGLLWENCSDGFFARASVGALAVAPSDPTVLYAGLGEATIRGNVAHGDGVYRSRDAGASWQPLGLAATRHIARVRVDPHDPQRLYVAALGHAHGPNPERGIYRSEDGGTTWEQILTHPQWPEEVGANELALDPRNPRQLYAALWRARRLPHALASGGEGCGLWRSRDGGDTWTEITQHPGLPKVPVGKIGVVASPARSGRVWATVEAEGDDRGIYRSDDGGDTWEHLCADRGLTQRPWYYQHLQADPQDPETLWVLNVRLWRSTDGGRSFARVAIPHGDNHDLWIDPNDPQRMIEGNDGGACVSFDGGQTWSSLYNQPTCEFYHVTTDTQTPYRVYGAQQDNSTISVPSRSQGSAIALGDAREVGGGESGYIAVRPDDPNIIYAGSYQGYLTRLDLRTGQRRDITIWPYSTMGWPAKDARYRFQWTFPIVLSPHDPQTLYVTGNLVFRSRDEGNSWEPISPDLTRHDESRLQDSGGPITRDNCGTEYYGTIFAFAESPRQPGVLWAGSDDGLVHVSRDGGARWEDVTPPDLPAWALISLIEPSPHDPAVAYLAATRYKLDDFTPYLLATDDYGAHWRRITSGLPADVFTRAIREDPARRGLLYAGTETGVWCSLDDGTSWQPLQLNLPVVPIHDLAIHGTDLLVATHGRSFWVLDDLTPLRHLPAATDAMREATREVPAHLFPPRITIRFWTDTGFPTKSESGIFYGDSGPFMYSYRLKNLPNDETRPVHLDAGENPRDGVYVTYLLNERPDGPVTLTFLDSAGNEIKTFTSEPKKATDGPKESSAAESDSAAPALAPAEQPPEQRADSRETKEDKPEQRVSKEAGLNRFYWNMRYPGAKKITGFVSSDDYLDGPLAAPGVYQVRLAVGQFSATTRFEIVKDPRVAATQEDLDDQFALLIRIRDKLSELHDAINTLRSARRQIEEWEHRVKDQPQQDQVRNAAKALKEKLAAVEEELTQTRAKSRQYTLSQPIKLNAKIAFLAGVVSSADAAPTTQALAVFDDLSARAQSQLDRLHALLDHDLAAFNALILDLAIPAVIPTAEEPPS